MLPATSVSFPIVMSDFSVCNKE